MAKTQVTRLDYASSDNALPLFCNDPVAQAKGTTDFVFDWRAEAQWGGPVPVAGAAQPVLAFANLALDDSSVLGRDAAVIVSTEQGNTPDTSDGKGLTIRNGGNNIYPVRKSGVNVERVGDPEAEGWRDFYLGAWLRVRAMPSDQFSAGLLGRGAFGAREYGFQVDTGAGTIFEGQSGRVVRPLVIGALCHIGLHLAFDTDADTSQLRLFADGVEVGAASPVAAPSAWPTTDGYLQIGGLAGFGLAPSTIGRVVRTFTDWPGEVALDPLELHQDEERWRARLTAEVVA